MLWTHPTVGLMTFGAEHALRERQAKRAAAVGAAVRPGRDQMAWISLRSWAGGALLALGQWLQGTPPGTSLATTGAELGVTSGSGVASPPQVPRSPAQRVSPATNLRL